MLVSTEVSQRFLAAYKELMQALNQGVEPDSMEKYAQLREQIYFYRDNHPQVYENAKESDKLESILGCTLPDNELYLSRFS